MIIFTEVIGIWLIGVAGLLIGLSIILQLVELRFKKAAF